MKSLEELKAIRDRVKGSVDIREDNSNKIRGGGGRATWGSADGARPVLATFTEEIAKRGYITSPSPRPAASASASTSLW